MKPQFKVRKTYEEVADYLRDQIISGEYKAGERLPSLRELGEMLGVGQSTIREAIGSLKTMGLVSIRQGEGTFVTRFEPEELKQTLESLRPVTKQDITCLYEVRKIIETGIVKLAAERRTVDDLRAIGEALDEMEAAHEQNNQELGDEADWKFHFAIASASHNEILGSIMHSISELMARTMNVSRKKMYELVPDTLLDHHRNIYEALRLQNQEKAEQAMLEHLKTVQEIMLKDE